MDEMIEAYCLEFSDTIKITPEELKYGGNLFLPIIEDGEEVGFFGLLWERFQMYDKPVATIDRIYIKPEHRDNRLTKVIRHWNRLLKFLRDEGAGHVICRFDPRIGAFWKRKGLKPIVEDYFMPIEQAITLSASGRRA